MHLILIKTFYTLELVRGLPSCSVFLDLCLFMSPPLILGHFLDQFEINCFHVSSRQSFDYSLSPIWATLHRLLLHNSVSTQISSLLNVLKLS